MINSEGEDDLLQRFEEIMERTNMNHSRIRLDVPNLCNSNIELIKTLSNYTCIKGIAIKKR